MLHIQPPYVHGILKGRKCSVIYSSHFVARYVAMALLQSLPFGDFKFVLNYSATRSSAPLGLWTISVIRLSRVEASRNAR